LTAPPINRNAALPHDVFRGAWLAPRAGEPHCRLLAACRRLTPLEYLQQVI
jgi:hypothetical protein